MKKGKKLILVVIALITIGFADLKAQELVTIRTYEPIGESGRAEMIVVNPRGECRVERLEDEPSPLTSGKNNTIKIHNEISIWVKEDFNVKQLGVVEVEGVMITTYILQK